MNRLSNLQYRESTAIFIIGTMILTGNIFLSSGAEDDFKSNGQNFDYRKNSAELHISVP